MITTVKPILQDFHIDGVKHITPSLAFKACSASEAIIIDVREEDEMKDEGIALDNILYHPMSVIMERLPYISKNQNIILVCPIGIRSTKVANTLNINGYPNVANLDGGFLIWKQQGLPFKSNLKFSDDCGCGCS